MSSVASENVYQPFILLFLFLFTSCVCFGRFIPARSALRMNVAWHVWVCMCCTVCLITHTGSETLTDLLIKSITVSDCSILLQARVVFLRLHLCHESHVSFGFWGVTRGKKMTDVIVRVVLLSLNHRHGKSMAPKDRYRPPVTPRYHIEQLPLEM